MITKTEARELVAGVFEEVALVVGGLAAVGEIEDGQVWRLVESLDVIRGKALRRLEDKGSPAEVGAPQRPNPKPHPAVEDFLLSLRRT